MSECLGSLQMAPSCFEWDMADSKLEIAMQLAGIIYYGILVTFYDV